MHFFRRGRAGEMPIMPTANTTVCLLILLLLSTAAAAAGTTTRHHHHRHLLHQPFFPLITPPPTLSLSSSPETPSPSPQSQPPAYHHQPPQKKHPFSSATNPKSLPPQQQQNPFFPSSDAATAASPPPPPPSPSSLATFPANISSILFPHHNNSKFQHSRRVTTLIAITSAVVSAALVLSLLTIFLLRKHRRRSFPSAAADDAKSSKSDSLRLFNTAPSDGFHHKQPPKYTSTNTSSEFLYLGTLVNSRSGGLDQQNAAVSGNAAGVKVLPFAASASSSSQYQKLGSPELRPLPPLPKYVFTPTYQSGEQLNPKGNDDVDDNDEFFSPRGSSVRKQSPTRVWSSSRRDFQGIGADHFGSTSFNSRTASYPYSNSCSPTDSVSSTSVSHATNPSPRSLKSKSPDSITNFPARGPNSLDRISSFQAQSKKYDCVSVPFGPVKVPPPPPPPPPPRFWEVPTYSTTTQSKDTTSKPPAFIPAPAANLGNEDEELKEEVLEKKEEALKPKLKPLHWDKVRASSSRIMVWDQIKSSSFQ